MGAGDTRFCANHPARDPVESYGGQLFCEECHRGRIAAAHRMGVQLPYYECAVTCSDQGDWLALPGVLSVHWLAHELEASAPPGSPTCLLGYPIRLPDLLRDRPPVSAPSPVRRGDLWVDLGGNHCGLVSEVIRQPSVRVAIRHLCPRRRRIETDDFYEQFSGRGGFYR